MSFEDNVILLMTAFNPLVCLAWIPSACVDCQCTIYFMIHMYMVRYVTIVFKILGIFMKSYADVTLCYCDLEYKKIFF